MHVADIIFKLIKMMTNFKHISVFGKEFKTNSQSLEKVALVLFVSPYRYNNIHLSQNHSLSLRLLKPTSKDKKKRVCTDKCCSHGLKVFVFNASILL